MKKRTAIEVDCSDLRFFYNVCVCFNKVECLKKESNKLRSSCWPRTHTTQHE